MRIGTLRLVTVVLCLLGATTLAAQQPSSSSPGPAVPRLVRVTGTFVPADHMPTAPVETVTLAIYAEETGGTPLWQETQYVPVDADGHYTVLLGVTLAEGLPADLFASGDARWLGRRFERPGEAEQARVLLASVPYALKAADADTLGGRPASAYLLADPGASVGGGAALTSASTTSGGAATTTTSSALATSAASAGTANYVGKFVNATDIGNSAMYETGGRVGVNTTNPADFMHVSFLDNAGVVTGYAVQNLGSTGYSGMLFYDQNGALAQFQGFNNNTHEYRINNIAPGASINFLIGSKSRFLVANTGNIGMGTTTGPVAPLEVSNAVDPTSPANIAVTAYTPGLGVGPAFVGRRAKGTPGAPTALQSGDLLASFYGSGYGATGFGPAILGTGGMSVQAAQNWTDTAQGTALVFSTTAINATLPTTRMTLDATGNLGVGTNSVPAAGQIEASNAGNTAPFGSIVGSSFTGSNSAGTLFVGRKARGTVAAPTAVQSGDNLAAFLAEGYGATAFSPTRGGMFVRAAENWTDAAQGTSIAFNTTATGTNTPATRMTIDPFGNVGIGTTFPLGALDIQRNSGAKVYVNAFGGGEAGVVTRQARGTIAAPAAAQFGDELGEFGLGGYDGTIFTDFEAGLAGFAAENWTSTAHGSVLVLGVTALGAADPAIAMAILPNGNVGIGTPLDVNGVPIALDKLQVFGDLRVGTSGTNGCLRNFGGTGIAGTCASDRRFKQNITAFSPVLNQITALQPVHYFWRAAEFPDRHFGDAQAYGLIAQDVEQVLPELVVTDKDGYKAIDYSELPLLTIEAVKELKAENDALKAQNDALKAESDAQKMQSDTLTDRVAAVERLIRDMRTTATHQ